MNRKEYFGSCLSYGLKVMRPDGKTIQQIYGIDKYNLHFYEQGDIRYGDINKSVPIVRSLDDLLKECTQSDYNDGKPFVPIIELAKMFHIEKKYNVTHYRGAEILDDYYTVKCCVENSDGRYMYYQIPMNIEIMEFRVIQQLLNWHFNLMDDEIEVVLVTSEFNPYK